MTRNKSSVPNATDNIEVIVPIKIYLFKVIYLSLHICKTELRIKIISMNTVSFHNNFSSKWLLVVVYSLSLFFFFFFCQKQGSYQLPRWERRLLLKVHFMLLCSGHSTCLCQKKPSMSHAHSSDKDMQHATGSQDRVVDTLVTLVTLSQWIKRSHFQIMFIVMTNVCLFSRKYDSAVKGSDIVQRTITYHLS